MKTELTYDFVLANHPEAISQFEQDLKKSKSKNKTTPLQDFKFYYETGEMSQGQSFHQMLSDIGKPVKEESVDEKVKRRISNSSTYLVCSFKTLRFNYKLPIVPSTVEEEYRKSAQEDYDEKQRLDSLTPAQRNKEIQDTLSELQKYPGFMAFSITPRK